MGCTSLPTVSTAFPAVSDKSQRDPGPPQAPACSAADSGVVTATSRVYCDRRIAHTPLSHYSTPGGDAARPARLGSGDDHRQHPKYSLTYQHQDTAGRNATKGGMPRSDRDKHCDASSMAMRPNYGIPRSNPETAYGATLTGRCGQCNTRGGGVDSDTPATRQDATIKTLQVFGDKD